MTTTLLPPQTAHASHMRRLGYELGPIIQPAQIPLDRQPNVPLQGHVVLMPHGDLQPLEIPAQLRRNRREGVPKAMRMYPTADSLAQPIHDRVDSP